MQNLRNVWKFGWPHLQKYQGRLAMGVVLGLIFGADKILTVRFEQKAAAVTGPVIVSLSALLWTVQATAVTIPASHSPEKVGEKFMRFSVSETLIIGDRPAKEMSHADFMGLSQVHLISKDVVGGRLCADVGTIDGALDNRPTTLFLKRTYFEPVQRIVRQVLRLRTPHYNSYREAIAASEIAAAGIPVYTICACGEQTRFGLPQSSFVLSVKVPGELLQDVFKRLDGEKRRAVVRAYAALLARLHDAGFFHRVKFNDLMYREDGKHGSHLTLIDRDVSAPQPKRLFLRNQALRNLASNAKSLLGSNTGRAPEIRDFVTTYHGRSRLFGQCTRSDFYRRLKRKYRQLVRNVVG